MFVKLHIGYTTYLVNISGAQLETINAVMATARPVEETYIGQGLGYLTHYAKSQTVGVDLRATVVPTQPESYERAEQLRAEYEAKQRAEEEAKKAYDDAARGE